MRNIHINPRFRKTLLAVPAVAGAVLAAAAPAMADVADSIASASADLGEVENMVTTAQTLGYSVIGGFFAAALLVFGFGYVLHKSKAAAK